MKTATIVINEVFGTNGRTIRAAVLYRNKQLWCKMENETPNTMAKKAREWVFNSPHKFTHTKVIF